MASEPPSRWGEPNRLSRLGDEIPIEAMYEVLLTKAGLVAAQAAGVDWEGQFEAKREWRRRRPAVVQREHVLRKARCSR